MGRIVFLKANWFVLIFLLGITLPTVAQEDRESLSVTSNDTVAEVFISPIDYTMRLAGSFGELRSNHFHGGIDIKSSKGEEGDTLRASMSGHVSRIKVQAGSYGQVVYIDHENGYTTVYAHMQKFADKLEAYISQKQYDAKSYEVDVYPEKGRFFIKQGEYIGLMGNTGRSYGPHLHFEIRTTDTEIPQNPYLFGIGPEDTQPPLLYSVDIHGLDNKHHKIWSTSQSVSKMKGGSYGPQVTIEVPTWRAGVAVQTFDLMNGASNKNGLFSLEMYVDDSLHFRHVMNEVGFDVTGFINSHIDYEEKIKNNRTLTKCYISPGNPLAFYPTNINNGEISLFKEKPRKIEVVAKDFLGNTSTYIMYLKRREAKKGEITEKIFQRYQPAGEAADFKLGSCRFHFGERALDKDTYIQYEEKTEEAVFSFKICDEYTPLFGYPVVSLPLTSIDSSLWHKVLLTNQDKFSYGGAVDNDSLRVRIGVFGKYKLEVDTIPPKLTVGSFLSKAKGKPFFRFEISDNFEAKGYANDIKYDVFIDGEWRIASYKSMTNTLIIPLTEVPSGTHTLRIRLEDGVGNITTWERGFEN